MVNLYMEVKNYNKQQVDALKKHLCDNSRNISSPKDSTSQRNASPKDDGHKYDDLSEIDICFNATYSSMFIKLYYKTKKTYRFDIKKEDISSWIGFYVSFINGTNKESSVTDILKDMEELW